MTKQTVTTTVDVVKRPFELVSTVNETSVIETTPDLIRPVVNFTEKTVTRTSVETSTLVPSANVSDVIFSDPEVTS